MEQLRIGMIGVGGRGQLWKYWHQPENGRSVVVAGADIDAAARDQFHAENPAAIIVSNYFDLVNRSDVDAIAVCSPDNFHEEHALAVLNAGKHLFLEKPMAITTDGCDRILEAWAKSGKRMMIGFNMRYMNMFRTMKEIVDSGAIGEIKAVWVRHFVGRGGDFYYHDWHANRQNTNSLLLQKGSHDIDMIHWITGCYTQKVAAFGSLDFFGGDKSNVLTCDVCDEVRSCTEAQPSSPRKQCAFRQEVNVEDNQMMIMQLEGGIQASYMQCHFAPDYHRNYTFIGTEGRLENFEPEMRIVVKTRRSGTERELADREYIVKPAFGTHDGADPVICRDFVEMVLDGKEPIATPIAGRMSVAVGCSGAESMRNGGRVVEILPVSHGEHQY